MLQRRRQHFPKFGDSIIAPLAQALRLIKNDDRIIEIFKYRRVEVQQHRKQAVRAIEIPARFQRIDDGGKRTIVRRARIFALFRRVGRFFLRRLQKISERRKPKLRLQLLLAVAKKRGFGPIIVTDTVEFNREFALAHGADYAFDPIHDNVEEEVKKITGAGADLVVVAAGANNILDQACNCARKRGEVGIVAMITKEIPFYSYAVVFNELRMFGAMCYEREAFKIAAELVNDKSFLLDDFVTQVVDGIENTKEGLDILSQKKENTVKVEIKISK